MKHVLLLTVMMFASLNSSFAETHKEIKKFENQYLVWPKNNDSGTFYLFEEPINGEWKRKGYIPGYTPIKVKDNQGIWINETRNVTSESRYVPFVAANGVSGLIKRSYIKELDKIRTKGKHSLPIFPDSRIVQPISPHEGEEVLIYSIDGDNKVQQRGRFSRSQLQLVVSRGTSKVVYIDDNTRNSYFGVTYLMPLAEGGYRVQSGWIKKSGLENTYILMPITSQERAFRLPSEVGEWERLKLTWQHWTDPDSYDAENLMSVTNKSCATDLKVIVAGEANGVIPLKVIKASVGLKGELSYQFPSGNRFSTALYIDSYSDRHLSSLKKIKCKNNSDHDWYAESTSYVYGHKDFSIYQDDMLTDLKQYFQPPKASGSDSKIEAMLELKELEGTELDYFSAYYLLTDYLHDRAYGKLELTEEQKIRFNAFVIEDITQHK